VDVYEAVTSRRSVREFTDRQARDRAVRSRGRSRRTGWRPPDVRPMTR
jgi:nitroreductase